MDIFVSFCNIKTPGQAALGVLDSSTLAFRIPKLPKQVPYGISITGLAASANYVYAALQGSPSANSGLLILDSAYLSLLNLYPFRSVIDVHSLWLAKDCLYAVSSGTDEVMELRTNGHEVLSESVFWRPEPNSPRADQHHLNAVYGWGEDLLVSGFGKKTGSRWGTATSGFIVDITRGRVLFSDICHPHSILSLGDRILCCESSKMALRDLNGPLVQTLPGYTRGLCAVGTSLFVGTSIGRQVSKSTGLLNNPAHPGLPAGQCTISRLDAEDFTIEATVDLSDYATEIYDLLPLESIGQWESRNPSRYCPFDLAQEVATWIPAGEQFILVDEDQLATDHFVAGRRRIPFLEKDGCYWGPPEEDSTAIRECERLRRSGANFIIFAWPSFWWLDYYPGFHEYLRANFRCLLQNEQLLVFGFRE